MGTVVSTSDITPAEREAFAGIPPVEPADFETSPERRDRALKHLLRANHQNSSVMYSDLLFHNHLPHVLGTAYFLGVPAERLHILYEEGLKELEPWEDAPGEISRHDWRNYLSETKYQRAFLDFFEDELVRYGYDWKTVVIEYMLKGPEPLIFGGIGGLAHPLIHLAYAFELNSKDVAMEALTLAATNYSFLHTYIDNDFPAGGFSLSHVPSAQQLTLTPAACTTSPLKVLAKIRVDPRFDGLFNTRGLTHIEKLFKEREEAMLGYYYRLDMRDVVETHRALARLTTQMLCATGEYDFFLMHLLSLSYAVRTLLPVVPKNYALPLCKSHWMLIIALYVVQSRPEICVELIDEVDLAGKTWEDVVTKALARENVDTHYLKAVRVLRDLAGLWKEDEEFYLKAAVKFTGEFEKWTGYQ